MKQICSTLYFSLVLVTQDGVGRSELHIPKELSILLFLLGHLHNILRSVLHVLFAHQVEVRHSRVFQMVERGRRARVQPQPQPQQLALPTTVAIL